MSASRPQAEDESNDKKNAPKEKDERQCAEKNPPLVLRSLFPPLPPGARRRREREETSSSSDEDSSDEESIKSKKKTKTATKTTASTEELDEENVTNTKKIKTTTKKITTKESEKTKHVEHVLFFDGAFRASSSSPVACGAVFCATCGHDCPLFSPFAPSCVPCPPLSAPIAELCGFEACLRAILLFLKSPKKGVVTQVFFRVFTDSQSTFAMVKSGQLQNFNKRSRLPNSKFYLSISSLLSEISLAGGSLSLLWVPRAQNREADEICNAFLDKREINRLLVSAPPPQTPLLKENILALLRLLPSRRLPCLKSLPPELLDQLRLAVFSIFGNQQIDEDVRGLLFCVFPLLLPPSFKTSKIQNRHDYKEIRVRLCCLSSPLFVAEEISFLLKTLNSQEGKKPEKKTNEAEDREEKERKRIRTLAARGLFQKIFKSDEITLNNSPNKEKIENMFPSASLPPPLPHPASPFPLSFSEIFNATRARRGAAPGLSGLLSRPLPPNNSALFLFPFSPPFFPVHFLIQKYLTLSLTAFLSYFHISHNPKSKDPS